MKRKPWETPKPRVLTDGRVLNFITSVDVWEGQDLDRKRCLSVKLGLDSARLLKVGESLVFYARLNLAENPGVEDLDANLSGSRNLFEHLYRRCKAQINQLCACGAQEGEAVHWGAQNYNDGRPQNLFYVLRDGFFDDKGAQRLREHFMIKERQPGAC